MDFLYECNTANFFDGTEQLACLLAFTTVTTNKQIKSNTVLFHK